MLDALLEDYSLLPDAPSVKEFVSKVEELKPAKELRLDATPGFGVYKKFFPKEAVAHPAKMNTLLLEYLVEHYTREGETVLDPMGGTGSTGVLAALHGRNAVVVELEEKFTTWAEKAKARVDGAPTLNPKGQIKVIKGDARNLSGLLARGDVVISSPPYHTRTDGEGLNKTEIPNSRGVNKGRAETLKYSDNSNNIGELKRHGNVDAVISSPTYGPTHQTDSREALFKRMAEDPTSNRYGRTSNPGTAAPYSSSPENIGNLLPGKVDAIVSSPPYAESEAFQDTDFKVRIADDQNARKRAGLIKGHPTGPFRTLKYKSGGHASQGHAASESAEAEYMARMEKGRIERPDNIGRLSIPNNGIDDSVVTSPPYEGSLESGSRHTRGGIPARDAKLGATGSYGASEGNIGNLKSKEKEIDSVVSSPPYEGSMSKTGKGGDDKHPERRKNQHPNAWLPDAKYSDDPANIGNVQKETYLSAMLKVYSEMWKVLKPSGKAVIVIKPFSRDKKVVDLPWQTWLLLEKVGFKLEDVLKLRLQKMSFWRIIQYKKDPNQEQIKHEYVIVVQKP